MTNHFLTTTRATTAITGTSFVLIGINVIILSTMAISRWAMQTMKVRFVEHHNESRMDVVIPRRERKVTYSSWILTSLVTFFNGLRLNSSIDSPYGWWLTLAMSTLIEMWTSLFLRVCISDIHLRQRFATRFFFKILSTISRAFLYSHVHLMCLGLFHVSAN